MIEFKNVDVVIDPHRWYCDITIIKDGVAEEYQVGMESGSGMWFSNKGEEDE